MLKIKRFICLFTSLILMLSLISCVTVRETRTITEQEEKQEEEEESDISDLINNPFIYSISTDNYGVESELSLQDEIKIENDSALKSKIPSRSGYSTGHGNNFDVWSWICLPFDKMLNVNYLDLSEMYMTYCVKHDNASSTNSFILEDESGTFSNEYAIHVGDKTNSSTFYSEALTDGWYRIYINFSAVDTTTFGQRTYSSSTKFDITKTKKLLITTSNCSKNTLQEACTYFDEAYLKEDISQSNAVFNKTSETSETYTINPNKEIDTDILFIGNSFIYSSDTGAILQKIADDNNKNLFVESYSKGSGIVSELYDIGIQQFNNGTINSWGHKLFSDEYDIVYIQAVFNNAYYGLENFLNFFKTNNLKTKIILLPADNEGTDTSENLINAHNELGLLSWCRLIYNLKDYCELTNYDLNKAADDWHANALSGYSVSVMIYYSFYQQLPINLDNTHQKLMDGYYISGSSINPYTFAMRGTEAEKLARFETIRTAAKNLVDNNTNYFYLLAN